MNVLDPLPDGGLIRKMWIGEAYKYRDHLLRLDSESRHRRYRPQEAWSWPGAGWSWAWWPVLLPVPNLRAARQ